MTAAIQEEKKPLKDIDVVPTVLRQEFRICRTELHCINYRDQNGEPCFADPRRCPAAHRPERNETPC